MSGCPYGSDLLCTSNVTTKFSWNDRLANFCTDGVLCSIETKNKVIPDTHIDYGIGWHIQNEHSQLMQVGGEIFSGRSRPSDRGGGEVIQTLR